MSKKKFVPEGELEEAIMANDNSLIIQLIADAAGKDRGGLTRPNVLATDEFYDLPVRTAAVVIGCGLMCQNAWSFMKRNHLEYLIGLMEDVKSVPKTEPGADEEELMRAVTDGNDRQILRLVNKEGLVLRSLSGERCAKFCHTLLNLTPHTIVLLLALGIHYASVPVVLNFLLQECEHADRLNDLDYKERLMLANLLIHILQGEIEPEDDDLIEQDWYPMGNSIEDSCDRRVYCHSYSYYFDPRCIYMPRFVGGEYEKPKHSIR